MPFETKEDKNEKPQEIENLLRCLFSKRHTVKSQKETESERPQTKVDERELV